jgi:hypothetical protein
MLMAHYGQRCGCRIRIRVFIVCRKCWVYKRAKKPVNKIDKDTA